jgi:hypothetical protein
VFPLEKQEEKSLRKEGGLALIKLIYYHTSGKNITINSALAFETLFHSVIYNMFGMNYIAL